MKKIIFSAAAMALAFFAASCQQENLEPAAGGSQVTFTVESPAAMQTKAIADGSNVDELVYEVWFTPTHGDLENGAQKLYRNTKGINENGKWTLTLDLVNDQKFTVLFWAQVGGTGVYNTQELTAVTYNNLAEGAESLETLYANDDQLAAFYAVAYVDDAKHVKYVNGEMEGTNGTVTLHRPFAQINLGTLNTSEYYTVQIEKSKMTLSHVPTTFNVVNSTVSGSVKMAFKLNGVPSDPNRLPGYGDYWYAGMNYVFAGSNITVEYDIQTKLNGDAEATVNNTISNVPLKENYRTNIIGNLLTSNTDYEIIVDPAFYTNENSGTIEVVGEGIVKNQNGDYEVTNADGLAYAINNLFEDGGNFYLTEELYDLSGFAVNPPVVPAGKTLKIYGETPVVTRSITIPAGVTIIGLPKVDNKPVLIQTVSEGGVLYVSGLNLEDENSVLVGENAGTIIVEESTADEFVDEGKDAVVADKIETAKALQAAINSITAELNVEEIKFTGDITGNVTILQKPGVNIVINGAGHKFDGTFYLEGGNQGGTSPETLTFKNINFTHTTESEIDFISANDAATTKRYAHNVIVEDCTFTGNGKENVVGMRYRQTFNMTVNNVTATGMHSLMWATGGDGITLDEVKVTDGTNGISFGTNKSVVLKNSKITANGYGLRADGTEANGKLTIENTTISASLPIIVRKMTGKCDLNLSNVTLKDQEHYQVVFTKGSDDEEYVAPTGEYKINSEADYHAYPTTNPVAKVGNTEYCCIEKAIAAWTHNTTLTLCANVTLSDVITLKSTEYHILDLGTYTLTAAKGKDAISITAEGRTSASYALDIKADANNPGGITATSKAVVKTTGKSGVQDRPIIRFYNGVYNAGNVISHSGSNGTKCPQFQFHGGVYNCNLSANRALIQIYGGTFNGKFYISVDSSAYGLISGGKFKSLDNLYGSALNSDKFTIGSSKGNFDRGVYVDDEGYIVVGGAVITEFGDMFAAKATNASKAGSYLPYSSAAANGLYYTNAAAAIAKHGEANVVLK